MRRKLWILATLLAAACTSASDDATGVSASLHHKSLGAPDVIVDPNGGGSALTVQAGINLAPSGARVLVMPGTYSEALVIAKGITLEGLEQDGDAVVILAPSGAAQAVSVATAEPVVIRRLTVDGGPFGIRALNVAANLTVERSLVRNVTTAGITATWNAPAGGTAARLVVRRTRVEGGLLPPSSGISTQGDVNGLIEDNVVRGTANRCVNVAFGSAAPLSVTTVVDVIDNDLDRCGIAGGIVVTTANLQSGVRVANLIRNKIRNSTGAPIRNGIYFEGFAGLIERNSILDVVQASAHPNAEFIAGCCVVVPSAIFVGSLRGAAAATPVVRFNDVHGNAFAGLRLGPNQSSAIDARCNWWGSATGPSGAGLAGTGDAVLLEAGAITPILTPFAPRPVSHARSDHVGQLDCSSDVEG
jgi:hypothetical protein